ncbi:hypothetical protein HMI54_006110 [Coelomomyces lativittatus]|nr:hypothetical protein HMI56_002227 [Coelomomyces lativittatus]KAJ1505278.1 hypothetical protein HMI54_006110 [Coelomomyces lativittatus]KAJ1513918.1 hypothetical protein HMI55_005121 [Coelomomyces lativittatus]
MSVPSFSSDVPVTTLSPNSTTSIASPSISEHRKNTLLYKDMLSKSKTFCDTLMLLSQHATDFSESLNEWSKQASTPYCMENVVGIQKYAEHLTLVAKGCTSISDWVTTTFRPQLETNLHHHVVGVKAMMEKRTLTYHLIRKYTKKPFPSTSPSLSTVHQLQSLHHHYQVLCQKEHQRCIHFVNQRILDWMVLETHWLWNPTIEHLAMSMHLFRQLHLFPNRSSDEANNDNVSFFTCLSALNEMENEDGNS